MNAMTRWDLDAFDADCRAGTLPTVSWLVAPYLYCEHPAANPSYGAHWVDRALRSLFANPEVWRHTVFLLMYDENDGFFDHVVPPTPPPGTAEEFVDGQPIGLGNRVPLWVISPWSRGGWVNSQVFDHTSVLRFLEKLTGVPEPNISAWRRAVCGDLTSCFDFADPDYSIPELPDTAALLARADAAAGLPPLRPPDDPQAMPEQEPGERPRRPLPYRPWVDVVIDDATVTAVLANHGEVAFPFTVFPNIVRPFAGTPFTVAPHESDGYVWDARAAAGRYDFTVHGADGFLARFAGMTAQPGPQVSAALRTAGSPVIDLVLCNDGPEVVEFAVDAQVWPVGPGAQVAVACPIERGGYDVTVAAAGGFLRRFAGTWHPAAGQ
ncbi:alkaline phosphatase family protein [Mycolicibacterium sp. CBMA 295]|uniref:alkaline phosphatase family protein n=1 Tax=Mycolicibacterium sp. CBMA 295 TaxID=2606605 RepID=UPI002815DDEB|nr:alkaline phosphatase family protein [Mycolicibacterium sp. CBMA 295]